jgi:hypothetical protein
VTTREVVSSEPPFVQLDLSQPLKGPILSLLCLREQSDFLLDLATHFESARQALDERSNCAVCNGGY